jgi:hypothetical protein
MATSASESSRNAIENLLNDFQKAIMFLREECAKKDAQIASLKVEVSMLANSKDNIKLCDCQVCKQPNECCEVWKVRYLTMQFAILKAEG